MRTRKLSILTHAEEVARRFMTAKRHPGYEKRVHRIQGFVAGALFATIFELAVDVFWSNHHHARETTLAWATAIPAALLYAWIVSLVDRHEKEPWQMLLVGFLWGTVVSYLPAALMNDYAVERIGMRRHLVSPFTEELSKGAVLVLIFFCASHEFDGALDGIVYGAVVGIGFALRENVWHFVEGEDFSTIGDLLGKYQFFLRVVLQGLAGHATYTAFTGLGLGLSRQAQRRWLRALLPILGMSVAILSHLLWNIVAVDKLDPSGPEAWSLRPVIYVMIVNGFFFLVVIAAVVLSWRKEAEVIQEYLTAELDPNSQYAAPAMMTTTSGRMRARWRILQTGGISAWWTLRQLQRTLIEIAFWLRHAAREKLDASALPELATLRHTVVELRGKITQASPMGR